MRNLSHVRQVCLDLILEEKRQTVFEILNFYFKSAKTIADFDILGEISLKAENRDLYLKCAENAYALAENSSQIRIARSNLYKAYNTLNQPEKALFYIDIDLRETPDDFELLMYKAYNLALLGQRKESEEIILSLGERPDVCNDPEKFENIKFSLSGKLLRQGDTAKGILEFINTFKPGNPMFEENLKMKLWEGTIQPGRKIYVNGEGGIGDEIINIRFFKKLKDLGMTPILYSSWNKYRPDIVDMFRRHGHQVICEKYSIDRNEFWTHMMALPGYLGLTESELWTGPYLNPIKNPKNILPSQKFKIGIKCNGNPYFSQDQYRSIPIEEMLKYLPNRDDVEIYYFDKDKTHDQLINMNKHLNTWEDTLDYIDQMDIIVSSCTSLVHAAGAMGQRTIVMVPIAEYYVWTSTRKDETTPWYGDNLTVLKQTKVRSWKEPLSRMKEIVDNMIAKKLP